MTLSGAIYALCVVCSSACAVLLARAYLKGRTPLLAWTAIGFTFFTANNLLLALDVLVFPAIDLSPWRQLTAGMGLASILFGFVWR